MMVRYLRNNDLEVPMFIRSFVLVLILAFSFAIVNGQAPDGQKPSAAAPRMRDLPFSAGIDLQFLIKELARDIDINVLLDSESFGLPRKTSIQLKNVTTPEALDFIYAQEGLFSVEVGPNTVLVASKRRTSPLSHIGMGIIPLTKQLTEYFGVEDGLLIGSVQDDSPASKAGIKPGDLIVDIDGVAFKSALDFVRAIKEKKEKVVTFKIVRDRKDQTVLLSVPKGVESWLPNEPPKSSE
ncbi:MAG: PDZ domain-containing protein [Pyrinomonadaceae bacterium]